MVGPTWVVGCRLRLTSLWIMKLCRSTSSYSRLLPGPERVRVSLDISDPIQLVSCPESGARTSVEALYRGLSLVGGHAHCLGTLSKDGSSFSWMTYDKVVERCRNLSKGLAALGLKKKDLIGVISINRPEFAITFMGCSMASIISVPIYETLSWENIFYIINQGEHSVVFCDNLEKIRNLIHQSSQIPKTRILVCYEPLPEDLRAEAEKSNLSILEMDQLEELGRKSADIPQGWSPGPEDLFIICYTSGTTGRPKGVMITHGGMMASLGGLLLALKDAVTTGDSILSYLPNAHVYEMYNQVVSFHQGRRIGYFSGKIENLFDDIKTLKPEHLPLVPRVMNKLYDDTMADIQKSIIRRNLLEFALKRKEALLKRGKISKKTIWDRIVFRDFQERLGGNQHLVCTTSAPIAPDVFRFFKLASGAYISNMYGQTELGGTTTTSFYALESGNVGVPIPSCQVKLASVPEMNYAAESDVGEICVCGPNTFQGYFKNEQATKETIDKDGWVHTGDIARWNQDGTLSIIDRKKHIFKLSQGEYLAPEKIETAYIHSPLVSQIFVDGLPTKDFAVAIVFPEKNFTISYLKRKGISHDQYEKLCALKETRMAILRHLHKVGSADGLNSLEQVKNVWIHPNLMTIGSGLLTPTLKIRRPEARAFFKVPIEEMYKEGQLLAPVSN